MYLTILCVNIFLTFLTTEVHRIIINENNTHYNGRENRNQWFRMSAGHVR